MASRRRFSKAFKRQVIEEYLSGSVTQAQLKRDGPNVNHKRVMRITRESDLLCKSRRKFVRTTDSAHAYRVYPNLYLNRSSSGINQVWVADITYIRILTDFVYLAAILVAYSRKVVGWSLSRRIDAELTCAALKTAITTRRPPDECIHHSDRGVQYAADTYTDLLKENGSRISRSRKGNLYDNPAIGGKINRKQAQRSVLTLKEICPA